MTKDTCKIIGTLVLILSVYTTAMWFVVQLKTDPIQRSIDKVSAQITSLTDWKDETGELVTRHDERIKTLEAHAGIAARSTRIAN